MTEKTSQEVNIQTYLRIRPSKKPSGYFTIDDESEGKRLNFTLPDTYKADYINNTKLHHNFEFTDCIPMDVNQDDVFKKVGVAAVRNALEGYNSTVFAYGQTGSGKTFTLTGGPERYSDRGLIPRTLSMIFNDFRNRTDMQYKVYISYLELYNEQGYDLLDQTHDSKSLDDLPKVSMLEDEHGNFHLRNLSLNPANNEEEALNLLFMGDTNRAIAETPMNMASSRSHCIFTISLEGRVAGSDKVRRSKLHLVDLAGSERVSKTNSTGSVLKEARYINSSLFYLEMVIVALYEKATKGRTHIPYRNSVMTSALRDSLGGNCKTIMIATINPEASHTEESISTCRFAQRVSLIKNKAVLNEDKDPYVVIARLKADSLALREEIAFLKGEAGEGDALTPKEIEDLKASCRQYCDDQSPTSSLSIGKLTLTKIKDIFVIFKNLVLESRANGGGSGKSFEYSSSSSPNASSDVQALQKQVLDLKSCLLQRDNEIAILVNMVKKGKTADDVSSAKQFNTASAGGRNEDDNDDGDQGNVSWQQQQRRASPHAVQGANGNGSSGVVGKTLQQQQRDRVQAREELILKRHLFGVPPPSDPNVFDDAAASFDWFRERCSLNAAMEENRELLKEKINTAKVLGERANQSRNTINYLKNSIEAIRRERAMQRLSSFDSKSEKEGGALNEDLETPEEETHRRAIEQEKVVYKESFENLRVLKPEIEHIRKILENCRLKMQSQFDEWYNNLHSRNIFVGNNGNEQSFQDHQNSIITKPSPVPERNPWSEPRSGMGGASPRIAEEKRSVATAQPSPAVLVSTVKKLQPQSTPNSNSSKQQSNVSEDDVNEDILAFYQAKEELLKRRKA